MGRVAPDGFGEIVFRHHAGVALEDVVLAIVRAELDGAMMAEAERANRHLARIARGNE